MDNSVRKFKPEKFQDALRAGWLSPKFISTNLAFLPDGRLRITPYEDAHRETGPVDTWAIGIELTIIDDDDDRRNPEPLTLRHAFGLCEIMTQYRSLLPHPIPLVPTSNRAHTWWIEGMNSLLQLNYYFSVRIVVVEIPGSHGSSLDDFLAVFYSSDGTVHGQIGIDDTDYAWPRRCVYLPNSGKWRTGSTEHTLMIPPTCRLFDIRRDIEGGYCSFQALTTPMDHWNVMALRRPGLTIALARGLMWMNGRSARVECAKATAGFKEELFMRTWAPERYVEWCLDVEEQAEMLAHGETFADWRMAAAEAEKKIQDMIE